MKLNVLPKAREEIDNIPDTEYAPDEKPANIRADLSLNINPYGVSNNVMKRLKEISNSQISHYYIENKELIKKIAEYIGVNPENILLGDGCDGCIDMIAKTYIKKNDLVIIPTPTFHRYEFYTKMMGGNTIFVPMQNFIFNAESILTESNKVNASIAFLCNPNNPTGLGIDKDEKIKFIEHFPGLIVVDEALADITKINGSRLIDKYNNIVIVRSFSKTFGLASLRIGYIIADVNIINAIKKTSSPFRVNGLAQELALEALKDAEHIQQSKLFLQNEREYLEKEFDILRIPYSKSITTNFLVDLEKFGNFKKTLEKLKEKGVLVTDALPFGLSKHTYVRIAVSSKDENRYFIQVLKELIEKK